MPTRLASTVLYSSPAVLFNPPPHQDPMRVPGDKVIPVSRKGEVVVFKAFFDADVSAIRVRLRLRDLADEFISFRISLLRVSWPIAFRGFEDRGLWEIPFDFVEKKWRLELVGVWERFNKVWGVLDGEPPALLDLDVPDPILRKRKADPGPVGTLKPPSKRMACKPKSPDGRGYPLPPSASDPLPVPIVVEHMDEEVLVVEPKASVPEGTEGAQTMGPKGAQTAGPEGA
ncbi:hypothetical protein GUJ93_ZPchr0006g40728 [Zizania palustris]|uniref:Uncharacterized protein n=1 Tax=Zizania palustris TaxID=103762 RepID=A0A8J5VJ84_ZIZPA|nr:hypothetical protein GUJ93_ZPchr0006g40728 [Zizania palustris]